MAKAKLISKLRNVAYRIHSGAHRAFLQFVYGMNIGDDVLISRWAKLDKTYGPGVHIGSSTLISFDVAVITHNFVYGGHFDTKIGHHCFVGARTIIMPGVSIGNHCVIGAGSVVTTDIPDNCIAAGNPAKVIRTGIETGRWGILNPEFLAKDRQIGGFLL